MKHTLRLYRNMDYREMPLATPDKEITFDFEVHPDNWGVRQGIAPRPSRSELEEALKKLGHSRDDIVIEGFDSEGNYTCLMLKDEVEP